MSKILRFDEMYDYEYEDFSMSDMDFVKELWEEGMTDVGQIAIECDFSKSTVRQILHTLSKRGDIDGYVDDPVVFEALPSEHNLNQLKELRKKTRGVDIGDRVPNMKKQGANIHFMHNPVDDHVETQEDFEKHNKKFIPSWNTKHLTSPFRGEK